MTSTATKSADPEIDYALFDADQHYYEARDCLTRHLEKRYRNTVRWADIGGQAQILLNDRRLLTVPNPIFDPMGAPGSFETYFRSENHDGRPLHEMVDMQPSPPEYQNRDARIARLDEQSVEQAWLIPTLGLGIEELLRVDPESSAALFRAYNRWLEEDWGYDRDGRLLAGPMISLIDPVAAEAEVDRVLAIGTRMIVMRAGPVSCPHDRPLSPADSRHDRIWGKLADAGVVVAIHAGDSGYHKYLADWGESPHYDVLKSTLLTEVLSLGIERPIFDTIAAMICHGLFDRHPDLKIATLELGAAWVPELHRRLRVAYGKTPQAFKRDPTESFREHVWVAPFYEDTLTTLRDIHGADRILLGSDWPHPEGLATPKAWIGDFTNLGEVDMRKALRDNQRALTGSA
jgi:predicted TIM-barrel fold metal-dependent hydrolase